MEWGRNVWSVLCLVVFVLNMNNSRGAQKVGICVCYRVECISIANFGMCFRLH